MNPLTRIRSWLTPSLEDDYFTLDGIAGRMLANYTDLASAGADRRLLSTVLTGLAGCQLAMSHAVEAADHDPDDPDDPADGPPLAESDRLAGLLTQEIAYCAAEGSEYRGVRCRELETEPIGEALRALAVAYHSASAGHLAAAVGQRLEELWHAVLDVIGSQAAECLVPLMIAHRFNPYACTCDRCADRAALPAEEQKRRAEVTRGCDQP